METNMETNQLSSTAAVRKVTMEDITDIERDVG
jgi:hypothetical protein